MKVLLAASLALLVGGCDYSLSDGIGVCTQAACSSGYTLHLRPSDERLPPGRYDVHLTPEADSTRFCFFVVSDNPEQCASGHCITEESCNAVYLVGYPEPDRIGIGYPVLEGPLNVRVERAGTVAGEATFEPTYEIVQPNGPDCSPTCRVASDELVVE